MSERPRRTDQCRYQTSIERVRPWFRTRTDKRVRMRLLRPDDAARLLDFFYRLSPESRRRRFHADVDRLDPDILADASETLANVDNRTQGGAVVAVVDESGGEAIIGVARLARPLGAPDSDEAEVAVTVRDDYHGEGIATELLRRVVLLAHRMGITTMVAEIEADNHLAIHLFRRLNLPTKSEVDHGTIVMRIQTQ